MGHTGLNPQASVSDLHSHLVEFMFLQVFHVIGN